MHELSIALSIVDIASDAAAKNGAGKVEALYLKLGRLSGVVKDSLLFCWDIVCSGTPIEGSRLVIEEMPVVIRCQPCAADATLDPSDTLVCPVCLEPASAILSGRELELTALEIV